MVGGVVGKDALARGPVTVNYTAPDGGGFWAAVDERGLLQQVRRAGLNLPALAYPRKRVGVPTESAEASGSCVRGVSAC